MLLALGGGSAMARDYYVSPRGDDAQAGSQAQPWRTIEQVNATELRPGDRVLFEGGARFAGTIRLDAKDSGDAEHPVEIGSYGEGRATIDGGNGYGLLSEGCSHLVIRRLNFAGAGRKEGNTQSGVALRGGSDVAVDEVEATGFLDCGLVVAGVKRARITRVRAHNNGATGIGVGGGPNEEYSEDIYLGWCVAENNPGDPTNLENHSGSGIIVGYVRGCLIEYCEAMENGWDMPWKGNGPVGIWAWHADRVVIQFCVAHDNKSPGWDGGGFDLDGGVTNSVLQYNYSYHNIGPGYFLCQYPTAPAWKNNIVRYNISVNDALRTNVGAGIEIGANDEGMSDALIYNNTVYNEHNGAMGFGERPVPGVVIRNNVFVSVGEIVRGEASRARFEGNWYWSLGEGGTIAGEHKTLEAWAQATGQEMSGGKLLGRSGDPMLVDFGAMPKLTPAQLGEMWAYRLKEGSPLAGAGLPVKDDGGRDFWGAPIGNPPSIGACEQVGEVAQ